MCHELITENKRGKRKPITVQKAKVDVAATPLGKLFSSVYMCDELTTYVVQGSLIIKKLLSSIGFNIYQVMFL